MEAILMLKAITEAQERYYLANNQYTDSLSDLDIRVPSGRKYFSYSCNTQSCSAFPINSNFNYYLWFITQNRIHAGLANDAEGKHWCIAPQGTSAGIRICKTFGKQDLIMSNEYYLIN